MTLGIPALGYSRRWVFRTRIDNATYFTLEFEQLMEKHACIVNLLNASVVYSRGSYVSHHAQKS